MSVKIDSIELDKDNAEFNNAAEFVKHTDKLIYLTGKAGTGKTTFLKYIKKITDKNIVVLAPTGVAAINAGGVTIHSFFQISFGPFLPNDIRLRTSSFGTERKETIYDTFKYQKEKRDIIENLELLIIDEISMVRCDVLDVIDKILRVFRKKPNFPFGGVQVILIGDTFQLPPIANREEWNILSQFYKTPFFFSAKVIENEKPVYIELKKIYRQNEQEFIDLLNRVRINQVRPNDFQALNLKYNPTFSANGSDYIILATHNKIVNETNLTRLNQIENEQFTFEAKITNIFPDKMKPTDHYLHLKVGAQIMFIKNDSGDRRRYYNGKIGKIKELKKGKIIVVFDNEQEVEVEMATWQNIKYTYNKEMKSIEEEVIGSFEQFPIKLAWAITVHKSQGLTFEKVIADLSGAFAPGQVYVALSRCTSFNGLVLKTQLHSGAIKTDPRVIEFANNETPETLITQQLNTGKADFYYKKAREKFDKGNIEHAFLNFKKALKYRNDIETEGFQRFITISASKLVSKKTSLDRILRENINSKEIENLNKEIIELENSIKRLKNEKKNYFGKWHKLYRKNEKDEKKISLLLNSKTKLSLELIDIKNKLSRLIKDKDCQREEINRRKRANERLENRLKEQDKRIDAQKEEIERLSNLKWYQRKF
ncbi:ATP-dependent DNA helicase [Aquimarina rhabdastrellae]